MICKENRVSHRGQNVYVSFIVQLFALVGGTSRGRVEDEFPSTRVNYLCSRVFVQ